MNIEMNKLITPRSEQAFVKRLIRTLAKYSPRRNEKRIKLLTALSSQKPVKVKGRGGLEDVTGSKDVKNLIRYTNKWLLKDYKGQIFIESCYRSLHMKGFYCLRLNFPKD